MSERKEAWMRIIVGIVSGIIIGVWKILVAVVGVLHWIIVVFSGKRNRGMSELCENWNTQKYIFIRYMVFLSNKRPFPFSNAEKPISKFEK